MKNIVNQIVENMSKQIVNEIDTQIIHDINVEITLDDLREKGSTERAIPVTEEDVILYIRSNTDKLFSEEVQLRFIEEGPRVYDEFVDIHQATDKVKKLHKLLWEL